MLFNVDEVIHNHQENEIIEEITANNLWIPTIDSIFKIPRTRIMKITFSETAIAKKATEKGILAFHLRIPAYNIKQDEFIPIMTCMRCYNIEDHPTSQCPKAKEYKICSECADEGHTWRDCKSTNKKCINYSDKHRTLANKCPKRKKAVDAKRNKQKNTNNATYAQSVTNTNPSPISSIINQETATKIMACMLHAHLINTANPGSYNDEFNRALELNNLPKINLPNNPPSSLILNFQNQQQQQQQ